MNWLTWIPPGDGGLTVVTYCLNHVVYLLPWWAPIGWC